MTRSFSLGQADRAEFDAVMKSSHPLRGVREYTDELIVLSPDIFFGSGMDFAVIRHSRLLLVMG
jgi:hypothetical protein